MDKSVDINGLISYGLDFGTSRSVVAYWENGEAKVVQYKDENVNGLPSLFWKDPNGVEYVCDEVTDRNGLLENPSGVCTSIKTKLKEPTIQLNQYQMESSEIAKKEIIYILDKSRELLDEEFIDMQFDKMVVGVPVSFNAGEKGEYLRILEDATKGKRIYLVPEPILAAIAYEHFANKKGNTDRDILVFDMGAGTFDTVLLKPNKEITLQNPYPYIAQNPDGCQLAGDYLDQMMLEILIEKLRLQPNIKIDNFANKNHAAHRYLCSVARNIKEKLSKSETKRETIAWKDCGLCTVEVTRTEYEKKIYSVIEKVVNIAQNVLEKSTVNKCSDIDILLVGGCTYMPIIRKVLLKHFYWLTEKNILQKYPEKAVALGAAIYSSNPSLVVPKIAYGYAVKVYSETKSHDILSVCMSANADLPSVVEKYYETRFNNQEAIQLNIYEVKDAKVGDDIDCCGSESIGQFDLANRYRRTEYQVRHDFKKQVPKETMVRVTTELDINGVLTMTIDDFGFSGAKTIKRIELSNTVIR